MHCHRYQIPKRKTIHIVASASSSHQWFKNKNYRFENVFHFLALSHQSANVINNNWIRCIVKHNSLSLPDEVSIHYCMEHNAFNVFNEHLELANVWCEDARINVHSNVCKLLQFVFFFRFSFVANLRITVDAVVRQRDQAERVFKTFTQNPMKISEVLWTNENESIRNMHKYIKLCACVWFGMAQHVVLWLFQRAFCLHSNLCMVRWFTRISGCILC